MEFRGNTQTENTRKPPILVQLMTESSNELRVIMFGINIVRLLLVFLEIRFKVTGRLLPYIQFLSFITGFSMSRMFFDVPFTTQIELIMLPVTTVLVYVDLISNLVFVTVAIIATSILMPR